METPVTYSAQSQSKPPEYLTKLMDKLMMIDGVVSLAQTVAESQGEDKLTCDIAGGLEAAQALLKDCFRIVEMELRR
jgi:hypothetical protein